MLPTIHYQHLTETLFCLLTEQIFTFELNSIGFLLSFPRLCLQKNACTCSVKYNSLDSKKLSMHSELSRCSLIVVICSSVMQGCIPNVLSSIRRGKKRSTNISVSSIAALLQCPLNAFSGSKADGWSVTRCYGLNILTPRGNLREIGWGICMEDNLSVMGRGRLRDALVCCNFTEVQ